MIADLVEESIATEADVAFILQRGKESRRRRQEASATIDSRGSATGSATHIHTRQSHTIFRVRLAVAASVGGSMTRTSEGSAIHYTYSIPTLYIHTIHTYYTCFMRRLYILLLI